MAIALNTIAIFNSIAALAPTGVDIKDLEEIPQAVDPRQSTMYPLPDGAMSNFTVTRQSQGSGGAYLMEVRYTLNYRFCCFPLNSGRGIYDVYDGFITKVVAILNALLAADTVTGLIDIEEWDWTFGVVEDPAGNPFYGCDISLRIMEFQN